MHLQTGRLTLIAAEVAHLKAELDRSEHLGSLLAARMPADWPPGEYDRQAQEYLLDKLTRGGTSAVGWYGWYARTNGPDSVLVGAGGFIGPPDENDLVMLGFSVAQEHRGQGYATEMAHALVGWALAHDDVAAIEARTRPGNASSRRVLDKCGFREISGQGGEEEVVCRLTRQ